MEDDNRKRFMKPWN